MFLYIDPGLYRSMAIDMGCVSKWKFFHKVMDMDTLQLCRKWTWVMGYRDPWQPLNPVRPPVAKCLEAIRIMNAEIQACTIERGSQGWSYYPELPFWEWREGQEKIENECMKSFDPFWNNEEERETLKEMVMESIYPQFAMVSYKQFCEVCSENAKHAKDLHIFNPEEPKWWENRPPRPLAKAQRIPNEVWGIIMSYLVNVNLTGTRDFSKSPEDDPKLPHAKALLNLAIQSFPNHLGYLVLSGKLNFAKLGINLILAYWSPPTLEIFNNIWLQNQKMKLEMKQKWLGENVLTELIELKRCHLWGPKWTMWVKGKLVEDWCTPNVLDSYMPSIRDWEQTSYRWSYGMTGQWEVEYDQYGQYNGRVPLATPQYRDHRCPLLRLQDASEKGRGIEYPATRWPGRFLHRKVPPK